MYSIALAISACSSSSKTGDAEKSESQFSTNAPTIVAPKANPAVIQLNRDFQPVNPAEVTADVKDFSHEVQSVTLKFRNVPLEIPMSRVRGTTWRAELSSEQLQLLAINGRTVRYDADVVAKNSEGAEGVSEFPVQIAVAAPDLSRGTGRG